MDLYFWVDRILKTIPSTVIIMNFGKIRQILISAVAGLVVVVQEAAPVAVLEEAHLVEAALGAVAQVQVGKVKDM